MFIACPFSLNKTWQKTSYSGSMAALHGLPKRIAASTGNLRRSCGTRTEAAKTLLPGRLS